MQLGNFFYSCILSSTCFGYICPSSGALDVELQHMVSCTEFLDGRWSWETLCRSSLWCGWCRARHHPHRKHDLRTHNKDAFLVPALGRRVSSVFVLRNLYILGNLHWYHFDRNVELKALLDSISKRVVSERVRSKFFSSRCTPVVPLTVWITFYDRTPDSTAVNSNYTCFKYRLLWLKLGSSAPDHSVCLWRHPVSYSSKRRICRTWIGNRKSRVHLVSYIKKKWI